MRNTLLCTLLLAALGLALPWLPVPEQPSLESIPFSAAPSSGGKYPFAIANRQAGVQAARLGEDRVIGQAWGDYDADGWLDLYVTDSRGPNKLFRNRGDGTFELSPLSNQVALPQSLSSGAVFADYDNDGWPDLYVLNRNQPNVLFRNQAGTGFVDVTGQTGVGDPGDGRTASWGDFDQDGFLDLYVANWSCYPDCGRPTYGDSDRLYRNNRDGTFTDVTHYLTSKVQGAGFVASFVDYDDDGDLDIYLINDEFINPVGNALWRNDGPGCAGWCFTDISPQARADTRLMGMGLAAADYDNDLDLDFYFSNAGPMALLLNQGDGTFVDVASQAGVDLAGNGVGWGAVAFDYDNDGDLDIYQALSAMLPEGQPVNVLFRNNGDGTFQKVEPLGPGHDGKTLGVAYADYDNDGWVDLVIGDFTSGYTLFRNQMGARSDNQSVAFKLIGRAPVNRDAIGARLTLYTTDGRTQVREVQSGASLGAGNALTLYFGLGQAEIDRLEIRWPDGTRQRLGPLPPNRQYIVRYPQPDSPAPPLSRGATALSLALLALLLGSATALSSRSPTSPRPR